MFGDFLKKFVGDVCLTRSQSLQLFLLNCALFVVAFIELSLSLFVVFSLLRMRIAVC